MANQELIEAIARRLADATPARSKILLFGSQSRGDEGAGSDIDILVIEPTVEDPIRESVRLRRLLRGIGVPIDVLVIARAEATRRSAVRGTVVERAIREGRILVDG